MTKEQLLAERDRLAEEATRFFKEYEGRHRIMLSFTMGFDAAIELVESGKWVPERCKKQPPSAAGFDAGTKMERDRAAVLVKAVENLLDSMDVWHQFHNADEMWKQYWKCTEVFKTYLGEKKERSE